MNTIIIRYY